MPYTMEDLIGSAKEQGFSPTSRLVQDWVELGLLDRPERHGLGRGKGSSALWSDRQSSLFLTLLEKRRELKHISPLCNVPVWLWLYFGDGYAPLRQVRRALATWEGRAAVVSWQGARRTARQLYEASGSQGRKQDREAVLDEVAKSLLRSPRRFDQDDEEELLRLLRKLMDPNETGIAPTVERAALTPEGCVQLLSARVGALAALTNDEIDPSLFHWARYSNLVALAEYQRYLANMMTTSPFRRLTIHGAKELVQTSCLTLVTLLGFGLGPQLSAEDESINNPAVWQARNLRSLIRGEYAGDAINVAVEVRPADGMEDLAAE